MFACSEQCGKAVLVPHVPDGGPGAGAVGHREHQHRSCHLHDQNAVASDEAAEARGSGQRVLQLRAPASPSHDSLRRLQGIPISLASTFTIDFLYTKYLFSSPLIVSKVAF